MPFRVLSRNSLHRSDGTRRVPDTSRPASKRARKPLYYLHSPNPWRPIAMPRKTWTLTDVDAGIYLGRAFPRPRSGRRPDARLPRDKTDPSRRTERRGRRDRGRQRAVPIRRRANPRNGALAGELRQHAARLEVARQGAGSSRLRPRLGTERIGLAQGIRRTARPLRPGEQRRPRLRSKRQAPLSAAWQNRQHSRPQGRGGHRRRLRRDRGNGRCR